LRGANRDVAKKVPSIEQVLGLNPESRVCLGEAWSDAEVVLRCAWLAPLFLDERAAAYPPASQLSPVATGAIRDLVGDFLAGQKDSTLASYKQSLMDFARFVGVDHIDQAATVLMSRGPGPANQFVLQYRNHLVEIGMAPATVNLRLAALRSLVRLARVVGLVCWGLEIRNVRNEPYRDCRGPGVAGVRKLLNRAAEHRSPAHAARDQALVRMMFDLGLRRGEIVTLDVEHLNVDEGSLLVMIKGKRERLRRSLPSETREILRQWLHYRGDQPGPLFLNRDRARKGGRLTGRSICRIIQQLGADVGVVARPHGLRHAAITQALELTGGDVRRVRKFSGHSNIGTVLLYDDCRQDAGGQVAKQVAASL
jgi:integrase/recombinase XerC